MAKELSGRVAWALNRAVRKAAGKGSRREGMAEFVRRDPDGTCWVRLPGAEAETPVNGSVLAEAQPGQLVSYSLEGTQLSITGNASDPAAGKSRVETVEGSVRQVETTVETVRTQMVEADRIITRELEAEAARIGTLEATALTAESATITSLQAEAAKVSGLTAQQLAAATAYIETLTAEELTAANLAANVAKVADLTAEQLSAATAYIAALTAGSVTAASIIADHADFSTVKADSAKVHDLTAQQISAAAAYVGDLAASNVTAANIIADHGDFATVKADSAKVHSLTTEQLAAATGYVGALKAGSVEASDILADHVAVGALDSTYAQIDMANVDNAWIESGTIRDGAISNAMIHDMSANKLTAGTIDAEEINVTNLRADNLKVSRVNGQPVIGGYAYVDPTSTGYASKNPKTEGWYELTATGYVATNDTSVVEGKAYYATSQSVELYDRDYIDGLADDLSDRIDGAIETWTGTAVPTLSNAPASSWTTADERDRHVGDVYFVVNSQSEQNGYNYRFTKSGSAYSWQLIKDSDVTAALQRLEEAEGSIRRFDEDISEIKTDTGSLKTRTTTLEGTVALKADAADVYSKSDADELLDTKVSNQTFNSLSDTVDEHSSSITSLTTKTDTALRESAEYIVGTQKAATGSWTGVTRETALTAGKTIAYKLPYAGSGNASLNLTLAGGGTTGNKEVYLSNTRVTTHFPAGSVITMTYDGTRWRATAIPNSNNYDRTLHNNYVRAKSAIAAGHLICGDASGYQHVAANVEFDLSYPILFAYGATAADAQAANTYEVYPSVNPATTGAVQGVAVDMMCYLKGTLAGNRFKVAASNFLTCTVPTSEDGFYYIPLGAIAHDATTKMFFVTSRQLHAYVGDAFMQVQGISIATSNKVNQVSDTVDGHTQKIGALETSMESKADGSTVSTLTNRVNTISDTVDGHTQKISSVEDTLATKADGTAVSSLTTRVNDISDTVDGHTSSLSAVTETQSAIKGSAVESTVQLWFTKANTTAPGKPSAHVTTNNASTANAWNLAVPTYNASYPNYFYCYEYKRLDGTYAWSAVTRDIATGEAQERARTAVTNAAAADTKAGNAQTTANTAVANAAAADTKAASAQSAASAAQSTADKNVKESTQLWFTKANSTAPTKPTSAVTSTATTGNAWTTKVPTYSATYPHYFYCMQYKLADGTYAWSDVVYDQATTEAQSVSRATSASLSTLQSDYATFKQTTEQFESTVGTTYATKTELGGVADDLDGVEERVSNNETSISNNASTIALKANSSDVYKKSDVDGLIATEVTNRNSAIEQSASQIALSVSETYATKVEVGGLDDNLIYNSLDPQLSSSYASDKFTVGSGGNGVGTVETIADSPLPAYTKSLRISNNTGGNTNRDFAQTVYSRIRQGVTYVFSAYVRGVGGNARALIRFYSTNNIGATYIDVTEEWTPVTVSLDTTPWNPSNTIRIQFGINGPGSIEYVAPKLSASAEVVHAESSIRQNADSINLKVSKNDVINQINVSTEDITIDADRVNITGAAIFTNGRLSESSLNDTYDSKGSASAAQTAAINAAATDATNKANAAKDDAISAAATDATNKANTAEANAISQSSQPNLAPWFSALPVVRGSQDNKSFWYMASAHYLTHFEDKGDGWARILLDNSSGTGLARCDFYQEEVSAIEFGEDYTWLFEFRNNASTQTGSTAVQMYMVQGGESVQFWGNYAQEKIEGNGSVDGTTSLGASNAHFPPGTAGVYRKRIVRKSEAAGSSHYGIEGRFRGLACLVAYVPAKCKFDCEVRVSVYEGRYLGPYKPCANMPKIAGDGVNLLTKTSELDDSSHWYRSAITNIVGGQADPDGGSDAFLITPSSSGWYLSNNNSLSRQKVVGETLTFSIWLKAASETTVRLNVRNLMSEWSDSGSTTATTRRDVTVTTSWQRFTVTGTLGAAQTGDVAWIGQVTNVAVYAYHPKLERGSVATDWTPSPEDVVSKTQTIYRSSADGTVSMAAPSAWVTDATGAQATWTTKRPQYSPDYPVLFVATQSAAASGTLSCTTPHIDDTTTVIDGGRIITRSITAEQIAAHSITAEEIDTDTLTIGYSQIDDPPAIPSKTSDLMNDSNFATTSDVDDAIEATQVGRNLAYGLKAVNNPTNYRGQEFALSENLVRGETYTIQFIGLTITNSAKSNPWVGLYWGGGTVGLENSGALRPDENGYCKATFVVPNNTHADTNKPLLVCYNAPGAGPSGTTYYLYAEKIKLEKGDKATEWTPAPEDSMTWYAECDTAAATVAKVATIKPESGAFALVPGVSVDVKFSVTNSAAVGSLTLNVNGTGAKSIRQQYNNSIANINHAGVLYANVVMRFVYNGTYWLADTNYNSDTQGYNINYRNTIVAKTDIPTTCMIVGDATGLFYKLTASTSFDLSNPILWLTKALAANATNYDSIWTQRIDNSLETQYPGVLTDSAKNKIVYLKGTVAGNTFTTTATGYLTCTVPTTDDGCVYIPLGRIGNNANNAALTNYFNFCVSTPPSLFACLDGKFRQVTPTEIVATHRIYYRAQTAQASLAAPTAWVEEATGNTYNAWTTKVPPLAQDRVEGRTKYPYLYTCEQRKRLDGTIECTKVLLDENTTVIDGGSIITNSVTANEIAANTITADELNADNIKTNIVQTTEILAKQINTSQLTIGGSTLGNKLDDQDTAITNAAKRTDVTIAVTAIDYAAGTATLQATLYIDGTAIDENSTTYSVTYQWLKDGAVISEQTSRTLWVTAAMGLSHVYSCTVTY